MPSIASLDLYLERSLKLLELAPADTHISVTYGSKHSKDTKQNKTVNHKSFVSFTTVDSKLGVTYRYKTCRFKDLSRLLTAFGPRGVQMTPGKVAKKRLSKEKKRQQAGTDMEVDQQHNITGFSNIMANTEIEQHDDEPAQAPVATDKKKSKKKSKKR